MNVIDLFAGCGGLSLGFMRAGYVVNKAVEFDPAIAQTYSVNHPEVNVIVDDIAWGIRLFTTGSQHAKSHDSDQSEYNDGLPFCLFHFLSNLVSYLTKVSISTIILILWQDVVNIILALSCRFWFLYNKMYFSKEQNAEFC